MFQIKYFSTYDNLSIAAANYVFDKIYSNIKSVGNFTLGLATGNSPRGTYLQLIQLLGNNNLDLSNLNTVNLDEFYPISQQNKYSFYQEMLNGFYIPLNHGNKTFQIQNGHILDGDTKNTEIECQNYENLIEKLGGINLQILGLGPNGHIGFNEPGSPGDSRTRKIKLTLDSKIALAKNYVKVPDYGLTVGIETILEAKEILLIVTGNAKTDIYDKLLKLKDPNPDIPASWLLKHPHTTIFTDLNI